MSVYDDDPAYREGDIQLRKVPGIDRIMGERIFVYATEWQAERVGKALRELITASPGPLHRDVSWGTKRERGPSE